MKNLRIGRAIYQIHFDILRVITRGSSPYGRKAVRRVEGGVTPLESISRSEAAQ